MRNSLTLGSLTAVLAAGALTLAGCSATSSAPDTEKTSAKPSFTIPTEEITTEPDKHIIALLPKGRGKELVFGTNLTSPPSRFKDESGKPVGFNVDFSNLIAQKLGLTPEIQDTTFDGIIPGLAAGRYDLTISSMSRTEERLQQLDMIEYMVGGEGALFAAGNPDGVKADNKATLCGLRVGVMSGSYQELTSIPEVNEMCARDGDKDVTPTTFASNNEAILAVGSGRIDAMIGDTAVVNYATAQNGDTFDSLIFDGTLSHNNIGLPKDSPLIKAVAAAMQALMDDGTYQEVLDKWGIGDLGLKTASTEQTPVEQG